MKLEKREITLNEKDSLQDMLYTEKILLTEYANRVCFCEKKETLDVLCALLREAAEDALFVRAHLEESEKSVGLKNTGKNA